MTVYIPVTSTILSRWIPQEILDEISKKAQFLRMPCLLVQGAKLRFKKKAMIQVIMDHCSLSHNENIKAQLSKNITKRDRKQEILFSESDCEVCIGDLG